MTVKFFNCTFGSLPLFSCLFNLKFVSGLRHRKQLYWPTSCCQQMCQYLGKAARTKFCHCG